MDMTIDRLRAVFTASAMEYGFREHVHSANKWQLIFSLSLLTLPLAFFSRSDYILFGATTQFWLLLAMRGAILLVFALMILLAFRMKQLWKLDNALLVVTFLLSILLFYINTTRPPSYHQHSIIDALLLLSIYLLIPNRFLYQVIGAFFLTGLAFINFLFFRDPVPALAANVFWISYIFSNAMGIWYARHLHLVHRQRYSSLLSERETSIALEQALSEVKTLEGILPICASCKKIRDSDGYWNQVEQYIATHSAAQFSHGLCEDCAEQMYQGEDWYEELKTPTKDGASPGS